MQHKDIELRDILAIITILVGPGVLVKLWALFSEWKNGPSEKISTVIGDKSSGSPPDPKVEYEIIGKLVKERFELYNAVLFISNCALLAALASVAIAIYSYFIEPRPSIGEIGLYMAIPPVTLLVYCLYKLASKLTKSDKLFQETLTIMFEMKKPLIIDGKVIQLNRRK